MQFCIISGARITRSLGEKWLEEFQAVWVEGQNWDDVKVSGVGRCKEYHDVVEDTAPRDPSIHYDKVIDPDANIEVSFYTSSLTVYLHPERCQLPPDEPWGFQFHSACWKILNLDFTINLRLFFETCLSAPTGVNCMLDWGHDYEGAAEYDTTRGRLSLVGCFPVPEEMRANPMDLAGLRKALTSPGHLQTDPFQSHLKANQLFLAGDSFSSLAPELLQLMVTLLPTRDVRALRLASPVFATLSLPESFWASRFEPGNEFEWLPELISNPPRSWRALYFSHKTWSSEPTLINRKRVWVLAKGLQKTLLDLKGVRCNGIPLKTWFEPLPKDPSQEEEKMGWLTAKYHVREAEDYFRDGSRVLRARSLYFPEPLEIWSLSVSFVHVRGSEFVSSLLFVDKDGQSHALGYQHERHAVQICLPTPRRLQGWELAVDVYGIKAIAAVTDDGATSSWVGEPRDLPRWHLVESGGISAVKAEFDAPKLVSLSRNRSGQSSGQRDWRTHCLWSPSVPPDGMLFNEANNDEPPTDFAVPLQNFFFAGSNGQHLSKLTEIVVWTFDICRITGIEFRYTDASLNGHVGHIGPVGEHMHQNRGFMDSQDYSVSLLIDGPHGEEIKSIEVLDGVCYQALVGLKIHTNFGRELTLGSAECPDPDESDEWVTIHPAGSTVTGLFCSWDHVILDMGLISTNLNTEDN